jgi:hypothetical protein
MMKRMLLFPVTVLLSFYGCTSQSPRIEQVNYSNGAIQKVVLSEYFQDKQIVANGKVLAHLITTLGPERVPEDVDLDISWEQRQFSDQIEAAVEVYFTNQSDKAVMINESEIDIYSGGRGNFQPLLKAPVKIPAGQHIKSEAIYTVTSVYRAPKSMPMNLSVDGDQYQVVFEETRTPVSELGQ